MSRILLALTTSLLACSDSGSLDHPSSPDAGPGASADGGASPDAAPKVCPVLPARAEANPPTVYTSACSWMDWDLSTDGFYVVSEFGTTADDSTLGHNTSCGALQYHFATMCCLYDNDSEECLDADASGARKTPKFQAERGDAPDQCHTEDIPETGPPEVIAKTRTSDYWYTRRSIDWSYDTMLAEIADYYFDDAGDPLPREQASDFPHPEYFYTAGAQRFGCDAYLRVSNPQNGRCIVAFADDGGPGSRWEDAAHAGRRVLDASPALEFYLGVHNLGWKKGDLVYVEWAQPGDQPGQPCAPCASTPAAAGSEALRSPFDLVQAFRGLRACRPDDLIETHGVEGGSDVVWAPDAGPADAGPADGV
jgi:hypothetical protein